MIKNLIKLLFGTVFSKIYPFLILNLIAMTSEQSSVGAYALFLSIANLGLLIITGGLNPLLSRFLSIEYGDDSNKKTAVLTFSLTFSVVTFVIFSIIIIFLPSEFIGLKSIKESTPNVVFFILLYLAGNSFWSVARFVLIGLKEYTVLLKLDIANSIIALGMLSTFYIYSDNLSLIKFFTLTTIISIFNGILGLIVFIKYYLYLKIENPRKLTIADSSDFTKYLIPSLVNALMFTPVLLFGKVVLENHHGLASVGVFELAFQWATIILLVTGATSTISLPDLSGLINNKNKFWTTYQKYINLNFVLSLALSSILISVVLFDGLTEYRILPKNYDLDHHILLFSLVTSILISVWSIQVKVAAAFKRQYIASKLNLIWVVCSLSFTLLLIPSYGALGLIASTSFSWLILVIVYFFYNKSYRKAM